MSLLRVLAVAGTACSLALWPAAAQQRSQAITVTNGSDNPIEFLYFAACGSGWGKDRLGAKETIQPGAKRRFTTVVTGSDCCHDLRAKMATGGSHQKLAVDVCQNPEWVVR